MKTVDDGFLRDNAHIFRHRKCVFIVGAGVSVPSGIPDFRSPTGIFSSLRQRLRIDGRNLFSYNFGLREGTREIYLRYIADLKKLCDEAQPNSVHRFLTLFPKSRTYTQNIDGLEERAGMAFSKTDSTKGVYLHGNLATLICQYCGSKVPFTDAEADVFRRGSEISCCSCQERRKAAEENSTRKRPVGVMHPGIIHYQQVHPDGAFIGKLADKDMNLDMLVVIGTSLKVDGIKRLVKLFSKQAGVIGKRIYVNLTKPTKEWHDVFDYFYEGDCLNFVSTIWPFTVGKVDPAFWITAGDKSAPAPSAAASTEAEVIQKDKAENLKCAVRRVSISTEAQKGNQSSTIVFDGGAPEHPADAKLKKNHGLFSKVARLIGSFDKPEGIERPAFNEVLRETRSTEIRDDSAEDDYIGRQADTSLRDVEEEIRSIVEEEIGGHAGQGREEAQQPRK